ncbi:NF038122 family metalloprotease [Aestuariivirga litoralis]|uniref:NF038122 family metalloprotease n=1 Tax=Aestuariivirga litoralis TaxID=2650924 RepID=UPI0018C72B5D|nr:NF038122 family metalloprotease [Aestuariivirga litoralis]MBG1232234.1 hypothetical protein [Aestuariivirga litoralis]
MKNSSAIEGGLFVSHGDHVMAQGAPWQAGHDYSHAGKADGLGAALGAAGTFAAVSSGGITFNLLFDAAAAAAPQSFRDGIAQAALLLANVITDKITVNLNIDYSGTGGGAAAGPDSGYYSSYSTLRSQLLASAAPGDTTFDALPVGTSIQGQSNVVVWNAQAKLFGGLAANDATTDDGSAYFATDISPNLLVGVALHELTHALGRVPYGTAPDIFDLFRFTSQGNRLFNGGATAPAAYFSLDGGATKLADFGRNSDPSDFLNSGVQGGNDPFDEFYTGSTTQALTNVDLTILHTLGFHIGSNVNPNPGPNPPPAPASADLTISGITFDGAKLGFTLNNTGAGAAAASVTGLYLSTDKTITTADTLVGSFQASSLAGGGSQIESIALALPANAKAGTYYLGVIADSTNQVTESNEANNVAALATVVLGNGSGNSLSGSNVVMIGLGGNDTLTSKGGNNVMVGGAGSDTLRGGSGNDHFVYLAATEGSDKVAGFHAGDHFDFSAAGFGGQLAAGGADAGMLDASHFVAGTTGAANTAQEFWFNTSNHTLYFDADGSGSVAHAVAIAQLQNNYVLHNTDIFLV